MKFTIPIEPVTKKNHSQVVRAGNRTMVIPSRQYRQYESDCFPFIPKTYIDYPVNVKAVYYMPTKRRVDLCNLHEALCDVLVKYGVLEDDNSSIVVSMDGSRVLYDKENPRTEVEIERAGA